MEVSAMRSPGLGSTWTVMLLLVCSVGPSAVNGKTIAGRDVSASPAIPITSLRAVAPEVASMRGKPTPIVVLMKQGSDVTVTLSEDGNTLMTRHIADAARHLLRANRPLFRLPVARGGQRHLTVTASNSVSSMSVDLYVEEIEPIRRLNTSVVTHADQTVDFDGLMNDATSVTCVHMFGDDTVQVAWAPHGVDASSTRHIYTSAGAYKYSVSCYNWFSYVKQERAIYVRPTRKPVIVVEPLAHQPRSGGSDATDGGAVVVTSGEPLRLVFLANFGRSVDRLCQVEYGDWSLSVSSVSSDNAMTFRHSYDEEGNYTVVIRCHSNRKLTEASTTIIVKAPRDQVEDSAVTNSAKSVIVLDDESLVVLPPLSADDEEDSEEVSEELSVDVPKHTHTLASVAQ